MLIDSTAFGSTPVILRISDQPPLGATSEFKIHTLLPNMLIIIEDLLLWELVLLNVLFTARRIVYVFVANVVMGPALFDLLLIMLK